MACFPCDLYFSLKTLQLPPISSTNMMALCWPQRDWLAGYQPTQLTHLLEHVVTSLRKEGNGD